MLTAEVLMSHSLAGEPPSAGRRAAPLTTAAYSAVEWDLLTTLPGRVLVAAASPGPGRPARDVAAGLVGLDAVAAGRASDSDLVRAVAAAIYARHDGATAPTGSATAPTGSATAPTDSAAALAGGLADPAELPQVCRAAVRVLRRRADPADSAAYRQWVESVAVRVCRTGTPQPSHRRFLDRLGDALDLR
ncbi:hypothetical protein [Micromonospora sp. RL09-050-HVF-A]|uniref:hypothetical protein n=1 Tax=unclassified Micromonospora TaxID=2617518 RepID=UPI001C5D6377|nr:hypothetical protein [Micromonospora sp. RL09-050-HVF-A]MBW4704724.1 hypothetical protein [Micromonospora sp. RL09-050-HVF-A]